MANSSICGPSNAEGGQILRAAIIESTAVLETSPGSLEPGVTLQFRQGKGRHGHYSPVSHPLLVPVHPVALISSNSFVCVFQESRPSPMELGCRAREYGVPKFKGRSIVSLAVTGGDALPRPMDFA